MIRKKPNKYGSKKTKCFLSHYHPSRGECEYCETLQLMKKSGNIKEFEYEKRYRLEVNGVLVSSHKPDFTVTYPDGRVEVHEFKGFETDGWRVRHKLFMAVYPEIKYVVVK